MIETALLRLNAVAITMPRISPIAQPVRQCRVADTAMFQPRLGGRSAWWRVRLVGCMICLIRVEGDGHLPLGVSGD